MASLNKVLLIGNLAHDVELKYTQNQTPVANMSIATNEYFEKDGQKQQKTEWHRIVVWGKLAENCQKYLSKGRQIMVEGRLETRQWEKEGQKHYSTEIIANNVQFLGGPNSDGAQQQPQQNSGPAGAGGPPPQSNIPF